MSSKQLFLVLSEDVGGTAGVRRGEGGGGSGWTDLFKLNTRRGLCVCVSLCGFCCCVCACGCCVCVWLLCVCVCVVVVCVCGCCCVCVCGCCVCVVVVVVCVCFPSGTSLM